MIGLVTIAPPVAGLIGVMLFDHLGWKDASDLVTNALIKTISDGNVTPDLFAKMEDVEGSDDAEGAEGDDDASSASAAEGDGEGDDK